SRVGYVHSKVNDADCAPGRLILASVAGHGPSPLGPFLCSQSCLDREPLVGASRGTRRSMQRRAVMSPALARSITFLVRVSASPSSSACAANVVAFREPFGRPRGLRTDRA